MRWENMKEKLYQKDTYIEKLSNSILMKIQRSRNLGNIDYLKCKLGLETMLINLSKLIGIYSIAFLMGMFFEVFVFHITYMAIRTFAYGVHCKTSFICTIMSCIVLVGIPMALTIFWFSKIVLIGVCILNDIILVIYAPASTDKNGIKRLKESDKIVLKNKALRNNIIILLLALLYPDIYIGNLLVVASFMASIMTTPFAYRIIEGGRIL